MSERPLVSFVVIAYNAANFIREAVEGAFSQTYSPLNIILSDDCSVDDTYSIMERLANDYIGPHSVTLNRNEKNLGIGNHVNRVMALANGEFIVIAAGDDVSLPERTEHLMRTFAEAEDIMVAFSDWIEIDGDGEEKKVGCASPPDHFTELPEMCRNKFRGVTGATAAWHRSVFDVFGPMQKNITFEDRVIAFRAALLGEIRYLPEPLVRYRRHGDNTVAMFHSTSMTAMRKRLNCFHEVYLNNIHDLEVYVEMDAIDSEMDTVCVKIMNRELSKLKGYLEFLSDERLYVRFIGLVKIIINGGNPIFVITMLTKD
jgi:glycosyltransferase involved in cell wall biosynthesis